MKNEQRNKQIIEQVPVDYYQRGLESNLWQKIWHTNKLRVVLSLIETSPPKILDVGCASGWFLSEMSRQLPKAEYYGIDLYNQAIDYAKKMYPKIKFKTANAHKMPFKKNSFDLVICTEVLEHVNRPQEMLSEIKRILKKDGRLIIELDSGSFLFKVVWFFWRKFKGKVWNDAHLNSLNLKKIEKILQAAGFKILKRKRFNCGMAVAFLVSKND